MKKSLGLFLILFSLLILSCGCSRNAEPSNLQTAGSVLPLSFSSEDKLQDYLKEKNLDKDTVYYVPPVDKAQFTLEEITMREEGYITFAYKINTPLSPEVALDSHDRSRIDYLFCTTYLPTGSYSMEGYSRAAANGAKVYQKDGVEYLREEEYEKNTPGRLLLSYNYYFLKDDHLVCLHLPPLADPESLLDSFPLEKRGLPECVFAFPSDEELASLSIEEKRAKCQIPEDVLQKMTTKDLLVTVLNCPLYPAEEAAISAVLLTSEEVLLLSARNSNGLDALLQRGDLKAALEETDPQNVNYSSEMRREMGIEILFPALQSYCRKE